MFSRFFIDRPIFASVLSIIITLAGLLAIRNLPIAQYPDIAPPTVEVSAYYPGANAKTVADTVAAPIEKQVNGVENMMYMSSQCTNDGTYTLTITFEPGVDLNMAQVLVQNREALAEPILPDLVKRRGVTVRKKSPSTLMIVNLFSNTERLGEARIRTLPLFGYKITPHVDEDKQDDLFLSNYATIQIRDELSRLDGIGDVTYLGQRDYSMRVWLDPEKMASRGLSANDVVQAVQQQNTQVAAGQIGQPPVPNGQVFQFTMSTLGRLSDIDQFANMTLRNDAEGRLVRLRDVARLELGAQSYDQASTLDGRPSVALSIFQLPGSNALKTAQAVSDKMEELKKSFPKGLDYQIVYNTTPFIQESVNEVFKTLRDAIILVAIVVLLFLQNWRSAIIPLVAVPVAIIGTFAVMMAMGFSLNNLTLFGLVLAIGIVVDDAIVVVEAVEHHIEGGLSPHDATIRAMEEVSGPVVAIGLVLTAVFVPCAFISGIVGQFFRQFALTIAASTLISTFNSLTLSPALAAMLLKPREHGKQTTPLPWWGFALIGAGAAYQFLVTHLEYLAGRVGVRMAFGPDSLEVLGISLAIGAVLGLVVAWPLNRILAIIFAAFNKAFQWITNGYVKIVGGLLRGSAIVLLVYCGLLYLTYHNLTTTPTGFIPTQDKGYLLINVQMPDSTATEQTRRIMDRIERIAREVKGVKHTLAITGQSLLLGANAPNFGSMYVMLDDFHHRTDSELNSDAITERLRTAIEKGVTEGTVGVFAAPPVEGLGTAGGFKIVIEDRGDSGLQAIQAATDDVVAAGTQQASLRDLFTSFRANTPWLYIDIDRLMAKSMGVSMGEVFDGLQIYLGSLYVNDFNLYGRIWQVNVQGDVDFRSKVEDLKRLRFRGDRGAMVPFYAFAKTVETSGPVMVARYNMYPAATINGAPAPGVSSGQAIAKMQEVADQALPSSMKTEWTELALLQLRTGNTAMIAFALAVVLVFLVLAAQYESWALPLAVILVVPMCLLCSVAGVAANAMDINIFTQIGFIVLVGLACKNAILIVEFAKSKYESGSSPREATLEACALRLRPIVMTSMAFILGVVPLVLAEGAGSEMRRTLGTAVFYGMLGVTIFGIFLTPVFYFVIQRAVEWALTRRQAAEARELVGAVDKEPKPPKNQMSSH